ncbi:MAG: isopentenyl-diphosphate Delta-isomerase [Lishizhenia sp.]
MEFVVLVDENDQQIGKMEKLEAHQKGLLHRAFSVLIFNDKGEMLIHQRAADKYHCGGLWTNACCSHPRENEKITDAAERRLEEEMGFSVKTFPMNHFIYKADFENGLIEHEFDHILTGIYNQIPTPNPDEVMDCKYMPLADLEKDIKMFPEKYTPWFKIIIQEHLQNITIKNT